VTLKIITRHELRHLARHFLCFTNWTVW